jgi:sialate O-acetylesterase
MNRKAKRMMALAVTFAAFAASAAVKLGMPFADHMVLQRDKSVAVWGTAAPGEKVTVTFAGQSADAVADAQGSWRVNLKPMLASKEGRTLAANDVKVEMGRLEVQVENAIEAITRDGYVLEEALELPD